MLWVKRKTSDLQWAIVTVRTMKSWISKLELPLVWNKERQKSLRDRIALQRSKKQTDPKWAVEEDGGQEMCSKWPKRWWTRRGGRSVLDILPQHRLIVPTDTRFGEISNNSFLWEANQEIGDLGEFHPPTLPLLVRLVQETESTLMTWGKAFNGGHQRSRCWDQRFHFSCSLCQSDQQLLGRKFIKKQQRGDIEHFVSFYWSLSNENLGLPDQHLWGCFERQKNVRKISQDDSHTKVKKSSWWLSQKARKNSQWLSQNVRKRARDDNHLNSLVSHPFVAFVHFLPQPCLSKYVSFNDIITPGQFHTLRIFYFTHMYLARALLDETLPIRVLAPWNVKIEKHLLCRLQQFYEVVSRPIWSLPSWVGFY